MTKQILNVNGIDRTYDSTDLILTHTEFDLNKGTCILRINKEGQVFVKDQLVHQDRDLGVLIYKTMIGDYL